MAPTSSCTGKCSVRGCKPRERLVKKALSHRLPSDSETQTKWLQFCEWPKTTKHIRVCSLHFTEADYPRNLKYELLNKPLPRHLRKPRPGAVPTIRPQSEEGGQDPPCSGHFIAVVDKQTQSEEAQEVNPLQEHDPLTAMDEEVLSEAQEVDPLQEHDPPTAVDEQVLSVAAQEMDPLQERDPLAAMVEEALSVEVQKVDPLQERDPLTALVEEALSVEVQKVDPLQEHDPLTAMVEEALSVEVEKVEPLQEHDPLKAMDEEAQSEEAQEVDPLQEHDTLIVMDEQALSEEVQEVDPLQEHDPLTVMDEQALSEDAQEVDSLQIYDPLAVVDEQVHSEEAQEVDPLQEHDPLTVVDKQALSEEDQEVDPLQEHDPLALLDEQTHSEVLDEQVHSEQSQFHEVDLLRKAVPISWEPAMSAKQEKSDAAGATVQSCNGFLLSMKEEREVLVKGEIEIKDEEIPEDVMPAASGDRSGRAEEKVPLKHLTFPNASGPEVHRKARSNRPKPKVLASSGSSRNCHERTGRNRNSDFTSKQLSYKAYISQLLRRSTAK